MAGAPQPQGVENAYDILWATRIIGAYSLRWEYRSYYGESVRFVIRFSFGAKSIVSMHVFTGWNALNFTLPAARGVDPAGENC